MIPFPSAGFLGNESPTIPFLRSVNAGHYICTLHIATDFSPPIDLVEKELKELYFMAGLSNEGALLCGKKEMELGPEMSHWVNAPAWR